MDYMTLRTIAIATTLTLVMLAPAGAGAQPRKARGAKAPIVQTIRAGKVTAQCYHVSKTLTVCFK